jgi:hypothetical protein
LKTDKRATSKLVAPATILNAVPKAASTRIEVTMPEATATHGRTEAVGGALGLQTDPEEPEMVRTEF